MNQGFYDRLSDTHDTIPSFGPATKLCEGTINIPREVREAAPQRLWSAERKSLVKPNFGASHVIV
jgi:hypothetical protein